MLIIPGGEPLFNDVTVALVLEPNTWWNCESSIKLIEKDTKNLSPLTHRGDFVTEMKEKNLTEERRAAYPGYWVLLLSQGGSYLQQLT